MNPFLSVAVVTYNHENYIEQAIQSIFNQQIDFQLEVIIGNDCSTDQTRSIVEKLQAQHPGVIHLLNHSENLGALKNMSLVLQTCQGKYIAILDGDDYWTDPFKLQQQVAFLESHPEFVACQHETEVVDTTGKFIRNILWEEAIPEIVNQKDLFHSSNLSQTSTWMFRGEPIKNIPDFVKNCSYDRVLAFYLADFGAWGCIPGTLSAYRIHTTGMHSMQTHLTKTNQLIDIYQALTLSEHYRKLYGQELRSKLRFYYHEKAKIARIQKKWAHFFSAAQKSIHYTDTLKGKIVAILSYFRKNETHD